MMLTACAGGFNKPGDAKSVKTDDVTVLSQPGNSHSILFKDVTTDREKVCMTPPPDSTSSYEEGVSVELPSALGGEGVSEGAGKGALALGGRSPSALITREILYRTCELMMNTNADPKKMEEMFFRALGAVVAISGAQTEDGSSAFGIPASLPTQEPRTDPDEPLDDNQDLSANDGTDDSDLPPSPNASSSDQDSWPSNQIW